MNKFHFIIILFALISCENGEQDAIALAQDCLNRSNEDNVGLCRSYIAGIENEQAYVIHCSIDFLEEGLTASKMAQAYINRTSDSSSSDPLLGMMGLLAFKSKELAQKALNDCEKSGVESFILFASMAQMATTIGSYGTVLETVEAGEEPTQEEMEEALENIIENPSEEDYEVIGQAVVETNKTYCEKEENKTSDICTNISEAITSESSNYEIGQQMLQELQNI